MSSFNAQSIGERLLFLRKTLMLSQAQFGERLGLSKGAICRLEKSIKPVAPRTLKQISSEYHVSYEWLEKGVGEMFLDTPPTNPVPSSTPSSVLTNSDLSTFYRLAHSLPEDAWVSSIGSILNAVLPTADNTPTPNEVASSFGKSGPYNFDRMNLGLTQENALWLSDATVDRREWPNGKTQFINWLIAQARVRLKKP